jgi:signal transduction histidine kinase
MASRPELHRLLDPSIALALTAAGEAALWLLPPDDSGFAAPPAVDAVAIVLVCAPLTWRSRRPRPVFWWILAVTWLWLLLFYGDQPQPPFLPAVALWLSTFSAASARGRRGAALVAAGLVAFLVSTDVPAVLDGRSWGDVVPSWVLFALSWAVGRAVGRRQEQTAAALAAAARAESARAEAAERAAEAERTRIARELHDVVTSAVTGMVVQAAAEARAVPPGPTREALHDIETAGRESLVELRRMLGLLRGPDGESRTSPPSLDQLADLVDDSRRRGLDVRVRVRGEPRPLPQALDLSAYRVVQEALTNARRHGSGTAELGVEWRPERLALEVRNGPGTPTGDAPGFGLVGLRERLELHGGSLDAGPDADGRFRLRAEFPLNGAPP